jgi:hypothetical protein
MKVDDTSIRQAHVVTVQLLARAGEIAEGTTALVYPATTPLFQEMGKVGTQ